MYLNTDYKYSKCIKYNVFKYCLALALIAMDIPNTNIVKDI